MMMIVVVIIMNNNKSIIEIKKTRKKHRDKDTALVNSPKLTNSPR